MRDATLFETECISHSIFYDGLIRLKSKHGEIDSNEAPAFLLAGAAAGKKDKRLEYIRHL
jgi:hypothetical protein